MADGITQQAPAKVNLALHVLRRRPDGYHELDGIVAFLPQVADEVSLRPAERTALRVHGPRAAAVPADERNLALRAANAMLQRWPRHFAPVEITLRKVLPAAAGIGGGSADAAAVIRAMCRLFEYQPPSGELAELALSLGADVPACLLGRAARMRGIGERLDPLPLPPVAVLLVNPGVAVSTAEVFRALGTDVADGRNEGETAASSKPRAARSHAPDALDAALAAPPRDAARLASLLRGLRNDLQPPARAQAPAIDDCLRTLARRPGALLARMSGSGATCFALFADVRHAAAAAEWHAAHHPDWWSAFGTLR